MNLEGNNIMDVDIKRIDGVWTLGYSLDKHTISSTPIGYNEYGHMQFDTVRPEEKSKGQVLCSASLFCDDSLSPV